jgi:hypothetical protein
MSPAYYLSWFIRFALAAGFAIACLVQAKKLGTGGALLMAGVAALDIAGVLGWIVARVVQAGGFYTAMSVFNVLFNLASTALVLVAMILWRKPPQL